MKSTSDINELIPINPLQDELFSDKNVSLSVLRLDLIDKDISGNKIFKLRYYLEEAINSNHKKVITFGGAYSNHLAATATACKINNLASIGIVPGNKPEKLSPTLIFCQYNGMHLKFISKEDYKWKHTHNFTTNLKFEFGDHTLIPEGGFGPIGVKGASEICRQYDQSAFTHICCAVGTGTTIAGIINASNNGVEIIGFSSIKSLNDFEDRMLALLVNKLGKKYRLITDYHFGGFAKRKPELIAFMNLFYCQNGIPTDFVYTGKMMFGIFDMIKYSHFPQDSNILCIHSGGLQGNLSLPPNTLCF